MLAGQFKSVLIWTLIAAGVASAALGETVDAFAILAIVVLNAAIGFAQELSAARSIAALSSVTAPRANVLRDGAVFDVPAQDIVVGDVLALNTGDLVAADARLLTSAALRCVESALTGESTAVNKQLNTLPAEDLPVGDRTNMVFMGTSVAAGTGRAIVVTTGMHTELGQIANLLDDARTKSATPLQEKLESFGRLLVWCALGVVGVHFALGLWRGMKFEELFMTSVGLAVAAVPEGLPAIVTVALALGVRRMAQQRALVRTLAAVETLGSTSVICTDKTGTLTMGEMTVRVLYVNDVMFNLSGDGYAPSGTIVRASPIDSPSDASDTAALHTLSDNLLGCNTAHLKEADGTWQVVGDPTEGAMLTAGAKAGGDRATLDAEFPQVYELPFDAERKRSASLRQQPNNGLLALVNGAPGVLLERCTMLYTADGERALTAQDRTTILAHASELASQALRVLASARRTLPALANGQLVTQLTPDDVERDLTFVGLTGMYDPPRPEAAAAIARCKSAGIRVVMITGDHPETATAIARELGIATQLDTAVTGVALNTIAPDALVSRVRDIAVYARVSAEHKLRIVRAWQANDSVVAMTGDGVNDAPAVQGADVGIAMGRTGTEVTRQAADMIITDDHFATIVSAVQEGRGVYANIRQTLQYLLAGNTGELLLMTVCVVIGLPAPLAPIHLLWINLVTDGLPAFCLATDPIDPDVMTHPPRRRSQPIADRRFWFALLLTGSLTAVITFVVYQHMLGSARPEAARSYAFTVLVFAELLRAFGARSATKSIWQMRPLVNVPLVIAVAVSIVFQLSMGHSEVISRVLKTTHMPFADGALLLAIGAIPLVALELLKIARRARVALHTR